MSMHARSLDGKKKQTNYLNMIFPNSTIGSYYTTKGLHEWHGNNKIINPKRQGKGNHGNKNHGNISLYY
jgi:hypothetical protein